MLARMLEDPWLAIIFGLIVGTTLAAGWFVTGYRSFLVGVVGVTLGMMAAIIIEQAVVTDREQIEALCYRTAQALEAHDEATILAAVDPSQLALRQRIQAAIKRVDITDARVTSLRIEVNKGNSPPTATADVQVSLGFKDRSGEAPFDRALPRAHVTLHKSADAWLVTGFELQGPRKSKF